MGSNKKDKNNLLLGDQKKVEPKEQMSFDDDSRPSPDVERNLANRETPYNKVDFPDETEGHTNYEQLLASEEYKDALNKLAQFTGVRNIGTGITGGYAQLSNTAYRILNELLQAENQHEEQLEDLCEQVIREHFKIPERALQFDFKLVKQGIKVNKPSTDEELEEKEEELAGDINDLTPERAKRRIINAMTQGHAVDGTWIFQTVSNQVAQITGIQNIVEKYSIFVATMMLGYWQFPDSLLAQASGGEDDGSAAGKTRVDTTTNPPTIHAEAMIFPFLIHEAIKGVMEFLGKERNPEDPEKYELAKDLEDQVQHEIWDIRLGPAIWRRLVKLFPNAILTDDDKKKLKYYIYSNIANLPVKEFLLLFKEVMSQSETGKKLIGAMYYDLSRKVDDETVNKSESEFRKVMDELVKSVGDDGEDLDDFLNQMGITLTR